MRALPGRAARATAPAPAALTRTGAHSDQRHRILRATGELVGQRGYRDTTLAMIVERAQVSYKTFYREFANKQAAFLALWDGASATVARRLGTELAAPERPWPEQVVLALRALVELILANPETARACVVEAPRAGPALLDRYLAAEGALTALLRGGRDDGPDGTTLSPTVEQTLAGSLLWSAHHALSLAEPRRLQELLPELIQLVLRPYLGEQRAAAYARE